MKRSTKLPILFLLAASMSVPVYGQVLADLRVSNPERQVERTTPKSYRQASVVQGKVTSDKGESLPGVSVILKGTSIGASTDQDGNYKLNLPNTSGTLVFAYIGYVRQEVPIEGKATINVVLQEDAKALEEVVVVGYGTQKKANLTGAVSTVDSKALDSRPVQNVGQALQGLVPGLNLQTAGLGGELNQTLNFNIRGAGTIGAGSTSSPLVLIDGMEGNLNAINPQDIETITVLKDAAAASIYGSRAPFGVILITTKKGKAGKTSVGYTNNFRSTSPIGLPTMMDSHTFALYWNEAAANDGEGPKFSDEVLDRIVKFQRGEIGYGTVPNANGDRYEYYAGSHANTDWFKEQYKSSAFSQDHAVSVNGGTENTQFFASAGYLDQEGLSRYGGDEFQRYTLTGKISTTLSKYAKFNYTSRYIREDYTKATHLTDLFYHNVARRWPTVPARDPNGHFTDPSEIAQLVDGGRVNDQTDWLYQQGELRITPAKGWNVVANANYRIMNSNYHSDVTPAYSYDVNQNPYPVSVGWNSAGFSSVYEYARKDNFLTTNIYSDYQFNIRDSHQFKILGGFNSELMKYRTIGASRTGLITPSLPTISTATNDSRATEGQYQHWATAGFFSRLNYDYKGRYLLELNARYDGTSRFTRDKRWNLFPSVSAGWNIAEESFWVFDDVIQMFKIRGSYGELGNQNTSNWYPFYPTMPVGVNNGGWLVNGQRPNTASAPGLVSSLLTWERVTSWNAGIDLSLLRNRLFINADYFERKTFDMVGPAPELPVVLGTAVPQINNADMESYGFEIEAKWQDRIGEFGYGIRAVLSDDQQRVTNYPNPTGNISQWYAGRKVGEIWGYTTVGIAKTKEEMEAHLAVANQNGMGNNWGAGDIMYADLNGDGKINGGAGILEDTGDRSIIGNSAARYRYSMDFTGEWKGFDVRVFLQGVGKRDYMPNGPYFWGASGGMWQSAGFTEHMDFFRDENSGMVEAGVAGVNKDSYFPKPYFNTGKNQQTQTRYLQNAAYMRLKNLQIGYTIPHRFTSIAGVSRARVYVSGENLLTFTKMISIFDPETVALSGWNDGKTYPLAKVYSFGLSVNF
ncbi:SusC/RagA family TonB-linked outer membrane protein [Pontibacter virosus]|uniref:TonB-linked SusC/RagA family outer membrane protein n=1 Tax=Pontibacter virosus TaxID=1765052 RepID=A0A2U1B507_9BACT|nr:TonB-dependent receptor [Pontibacter virosus]PVY43759.1 TonB-linked SusC/RagA family outer membrane protein [Pontibacter virosus]